MGLKSLPNLFTYKSEVTDCNLRNISSSLCLPQPRTNKGPFTKYVTLVGVGGVFDQESHTVT